MKLEIHEGAAIKLLLFDKYKSEFEMIKGIHQHPKYNFYEWLYANEIISKEHLDLQLEAIQEVDYED